MSDPITFNQYEALAFLVRYGNLYQLHDDPTKGWGGSGEWWRSVDPEHAGKYLKMFPSETVDWLLQEGLADRAEHDANFASAKITPTDAARARLENSGLTSESKGVGVHLEHCCLEHHGCKYGDPFCPVVTRMFPPRYDRCGLCDEDDASLSEALGEYHDEELIQELESRGYQVSRDRDAGS